MSLLNNQMFGVLLAGIVVAGCQVVPHVVHAQDGVPLSDQLQGTGAPATSAQGASLGAAQDCTDASVNYEDDPTLTPAEKAERMNQALFRSLSHFDACQSAAEGGGGGGNGAGGGGAGADGDGGGAGAGEGEGTDGNGTGSVASTGMSGTEKTAVPDSGQNGSGQDGTGTSSDSANTGSDTLEPGDFESTQGEAPGTGGKDGPSGKNLGNGKVPEDIPSANNDSVLEGQIRQAAMNETDPKIKAQLWNEYRKYKGLPAVK
ncbi:hypothetical protein [Magnetovibrio blakemorei]|uniref:hypothetical protein n=1 Tax=Magnetovibrio blakemorei TaxID=28181 RepID=UPI001112ECB4|nr:hypothetical protein [Magnetovibrio blakemorei]